MQVMGTHNTYEIGKIYIIDLSDGNKNIHHDIPVYFVRKITFEEWAKERTNPEAPLVFESKFYETANYYEISID